MPFILSAGALETGTKLLLDSGAVNDEDTLADALGLPSSALDLTDIDEIIASMAATTTSTGIVAIDGPPPNDSAATTSTPSSSLFAAKKKLDGVTERLFAIYRVWGVAATAPTRSPHAYGGSSGSERGVAPRLHLRPRR